MPPPRRLRLLLLSANFAAGGAERHMLELATRLDAGLFDIHIAHIKPEAPLLDVPSFAHCEAFSCAGTRWIDIPAARRLARFIDDNAIESVLCSSFYAAMIALMARRFAGSRFAISVVYHSTILRTLKERLQMKFYTLMLRQYQLVVFLCRNQRKHWRDSGYAAPTREVTIYNGIDVAAFSPDAVPMEAVARCRAEAGFSAADYVVGICAALRPEKAHLDLLRAMTILKRDCPHAKLLIIGDGPERRNIEAEIERAGMGPNVFIAGYQQDVRPWVSASDVMVLASTAIETFSLAALESMALEKPLIMTDIGGASEQISPGTNGYLFPPADVELLAHHLFSLANPELRRKFGREARAVVSSEFDIAQMLACYERELLALSLPQTNQ
jgi:glycosyltransferase involved in cell wall biosynthesis